MRNLFYKFLWSIPVIFFTLVLLQVIAGKKKSPPPLKTNHGFIEAAGIKLNIQTNKSSHIKIKANWIQIQNLPHNDNILIICKENVSYSESKKKFISADYAEIILERKKKLDYSIKSKNILSIFFKDQVKIKTENESIFTSEAKYLPKEKLIYGNKELIVESSKGYFFKSKKGFEWNLKNKVINLNGKTTGSFSTL